MARFFAYLNVYKVDIEGGEVGHSEPKRGRRMYVKYKVSVSSPYLASMSGLMGGMVAVSVVAPKPFGWILLGLIFCGFAFMAFWLIRTAWTHKTLSFEDEELNFPNHKVLPQDIRHVFLYEKAGAFTIVFVRGRLPLSISCKRRDTQDFLTAVRGWAWRNGVQTRTNMTTKKRKDK